MENQKKKESNDDQKDSSSSSGDEVPEVLHIQPHRTRGQPGRPVGTSPVQYSYDEMRTIFDLLLQHCPANPCGLEMLKELHLALKRPIQGLQTFISRKLKRMVPRLLADKFNGQYSQISKSQRMFLKEFMKSCPTFKIPKKDSRLHNYSPLQFFQPRVTSTPSMKTPKRSMEAVSSSSVRPANVGSFQEQFVRNIVRDVINKIQCGEDSGNPGTSHPMQGLGFGSVLDDWAKVKIERPQMSELEEAEVKDTHILAPPSDEESQQVGGENESDVPRKDSENVSSLEPKNPCAQPAAERSELCLDLKSTDDETSGAHSRSNSTNFTGSGESALFKSTGFSEDTLTNIVQGDSDEYVQKFASSNLRARIVTSTAVQIYEVEEDCDVDDDFLVIKENGKYILRHRCTLPSEWSMQPGTVSDSPQDESRHILKKDILSIVGDDGVLSPMIIDDKHTKKLVKVVSMKTGKGKNISVLLTTK